MSTETNQDGAAADTKSGGEGTPTPATIPVSKEEYDLLKKVEAEHGSLKRDFKDLKKSVEEREKAGTPTKETKPEDSDLLKKAFLRTAGITTEKEVELALSTAQKWGVPIDVLVEDDDFKAKLDKHRAQESNLAAAAGVKAGSPGQGQAKLEPSYWVAKGVPPTPTDVPDRKTRQKIVREYLKTHKGGGKTFYND